MIKVHSQTSNTATLMLHNLIASYLFEEEYGELLTATKTDKKRLEMVMKALENIIKKGIKNDKGKHKAKS